MDCMLVVHVSDSERCPPSQVLIHSLLSMFHPRPFIKSRFAPQGAVACIQASSDFYFHIAFRSETIWLDLFWKVPPQNKRRHFNFVYKCTIFCISKIQIEFPFIDIIDIYCGDCCCPQDPCRVPAQRRPWFPLLVYAWAVHWPHHHVQGCVTYTRFPPLRAQQ